jgi:hypothetical protein
MVSSSCCHIDAWLQPALLQEQGHRQQNENHCPPKCKMHHTLCAQVDPRVHSALSKMQPKSATVLSCTPECCMHTVMLIAHNTIVDLCCPALPCFCPFTCAIICCSLVARALPQQHQVSVGVACIGGCWHAAATCGACQQLLQALLQEYLLVP